jgi:hypothetical protein
MGQKLTALADSRGVITFQHERKAPDGLISFARGWSKPLRENVEVNARHAYDGKTLLVPGIPEAEHDDDALDALERFGLLIKMRLDGLQGWP